GPMYQSWLTLGFDDSTTAETVDKSWIDLSPRYDSYYSKLEYLEVYLSSLDEMSINIEVSGNVENVNLTHCMRNVSYAYVFVESVDDELSSKMSDSIENKRYMFCFNSFPYQCFFYLTSQYDLPRNITMYGGLGYGLKYKNHPYELVLNKRVENLTPLEDYPFDEYEIKIPLFLPSKKIEINRIKVCGFDGLLIKNTSIQLINSVIYDRDSGELHVPEFVNADDINKDIKLNSRLINDGRCVILSSGSSLKTFEIDGYWLLSINTVLKRNTSEFTNFVNLFMLLVITIIIIFVLNVLLRSKLPNKIDKFIKPHTVFAAYFLWIISQYSSVIGKVDVDNSIFIRTMNVCLIIYVVIFLLLEIGVYYYSNNVTSPHIRN
ncbi:MAG: hypothetical protein KAJ51_16835, partial [Thermoplasmata archaeon]|nr:hypothetical protein [Thermoplasmata archaeon]